MELRATNAHTTKPIRIDGRRMNMVLFAQLFVVPISSSFVVPQTCNSIAIACSMHLFAEMFHVKKSMPHNEKIFDSRRVIANPEKVNQYVEPSI